MPTPEFVPEWAKHAIWYQIFPERFRNGDPNNDPTLESQVNSWPHDLSQPWQVHPWTADWYAQQPYEAIHAKPIWYHLQRRRYGGDLQGILDRLDYLIDLGVNALYLNPVFQAPSSHKYDGATYHHVDPHFGPDPAGDLRLIADETPDDPSTWVWTAADRLLLDLISEVHQRGMHIILDGVFNHMGLNSWAFRDIVQHRQSSAFRNWFKILDWEQPSLYAPFTFVGWAGTNELPELNQDSNGITSGPKRYIFEITRRWMDPDGDGDPHDGIDGWRLDVAFCVRHGFWKDWRRHVKSINPQAYLTAEIVLEDDNAPYLQGDEFDAVMNYVWAIICAEFFAEERAAIPTSEFDRRLRELRRAYPGGVEYAMQNLLDSHDTPRIATHILNRNSLSYGAWKELMHKSQRRMNPALDTGAPDAATRQIQQLMVLFQMTYVGAPMIYYGDEAGMWGANDPCCRKPMVWPELQYEPEAAAPEGGLLERPGPVAFDHALHGLYKRLIAIRRGSPALQVGDFNTLLVDDLHGLYAFERSYNDERVVVALNNQPQTRAVTLPLHGSWRDLLAPEAIYQAGAAGLAIELAGRWGAVLQTLE
jgi:cyclomaltodextrinase / maltogenic alpha-amylase / neopullulanase